MSDLIHRRDINPDAYDLVSVPVDIRLTRTNDGWQVEEIVACGTDDEVGVHIDALVQEATDA